MLPLARAEPNAPSSQLIGAPAPPASPDASTLHSTVHPTLLTALQSRLAQGPVSVYDVAVGGVRIVDYVHLLDIIPPYGKGTVYTHIHTGTLL